jgi:hypothetical protein
VPIRQGPGAPQQDVVQVCQLLCDLLGALFGFPSQGREAGLLLRVLAVLVRAEAFAFTRVGVTLALCLPLGQVGFDSGHFPGLLRFLAFEELLALRRQPSLLSCRVGGSLRAARSGRRALLCLLFAPGFGQLGLLAQP